MTDKNSKTTETTSIPVQTGVISLPLLFTNDNELTLDKFRTTIAGMNHLLCLLDDGDIEEIQTDIGNRFKYADLNIWTSNRPALAYAHDHGFLCDFLTALSSARDHFVSSGVEEDGFVVITEEMADSEFKIVKEKGGQLCIHFKPAELMQG